MTRHKIFSALGRKDENPHSLLPLSKTKCSRLRALGNVHPTVSPHRATLSILRAAHASGAH